MAYLSVYPVDANELASTGGNSVWDIINHGLDIVGDIVRPPGTMTGRGSRQNPGYPTYPTPYPGATNNNGAGTGGGAAPVASSNTGTLVIVGLTVVAAVALMGRK